MIFFFIWSLVLVCVLNIPFGYWRENVRKLSLSWFMAIHLPVPFVALLRHHLQLPGVTLLAFLAAYFLGQYLGGRLSRTLRPYGKVSSSLVHDLAHRSWIIVIGRQIGR